MRNWFVCGDSLEVLQALPADSVDLVIGSPPYESARTYGIGYKLKGQAWVDWCLARYLECVRVCRGLVAWVVEGQTRDFRYSAGPALLMADLHRAGVRLRKPVAFHRVGIPGSGGPDWLRNDWEWVVCASKGKLPWADNTACGHPPRWAPGGAMSHRVTNGTRRNQWGGGEQSTAARRADGSFDDGPRKSHSFVTKSEIEAAAAAGGRVGRSMKLKRSKLGADRGGGVSTDGEYEWVYVPPVKANPGNVLRLNVGGGQMGSRLCHENEAPFPEKLAEFFIRSFCPQGGLVLDPFSGSGTSCAMAKKWGRDFLGVDVRADQVALGCRRVAEVVAGSGQP